MPLLVLTGACATAPRDAEVRALLRDYAGDGPGASVLVLHEGEPVYRAGFGFADLEARVPATSDTHYRLASVTKQFTAAAILTLAGSGSLRLSDPVRKFLPALPPATDPITIEHLLTHTSGLVDYEDLVPEGTKEQLKDADVLRLLEQQNRLEFAPGSSYRYSNSGYALLALVVERASGRTFSRFLREEIFGPVGMAHAVAHEEGISSIANRAWGYSRTDTGWKRDDQSLTSAVLGDGGVYASVDELALWLGAQDGERFAALSIPRVDTDVAGTRYGYGLRIHEHRGMRVISHTGETRGFRNAMVRFPDQRLAVVVLTNRNEGTPIHLALAIADEYLRGADSK